MITVKEAMAMLGKKFPDKRIRGNPGLAGDLYVFAFPNKNASEEEAMWDHTAVCVDRNTGEISWHNVFEPSIWNADPISMD